MDPYSLLRAHTHTHTNGCTHTHTYRSTALGMHLLMARIGAIIGTNLFGEFVYISPSIPILLVASVLLVGGVAAIPIPKTTRKTLLG